MNASLQHRTLTAAEGKLEALHARFRDHTLAPFKTSETQGALTTKIESVFAEPTDYSPMK